MNKNLKLKSVNFPSTGKPLFPKEYLLLTFSRHTKLLCTRAMPCETLYTYSVKQPSQIMFWALLLRAQFICHTTESGNMKYQCHEIQSCEVEKNKIHTRYNLIRCVSSHRFDTNLDVNVWGSAWDLGVWDYITFSGKWGSGGRGAHRLCCKYVHQISWLVIHWK